MFDLSIKNKVLFFIIALFGVSFVGFLSVLTNFQNNKMQEIQTERLSRVGESFKKNIELHLKTYYSNLMTDFLSKEMTKEVAFENREELLKITQEKYFQMIKEDGNILQVHFHKKDGKTLLRLHDIDLYDDEIAKIRVMPQIIHQEQHAISGFELGKNGIGYRIFQPIFYENRYAGALEFGVSPHKIVNLVTYFNKVDGVLIFNDSSKNDASVQFQKISNEELKRFLDNNPSAIKTQKIDTDDGKYYAISSFDVLDYSSKAIGKFLFFDDMTLQYKEYRKYLIMFFVNFTVFFIFIIVVTNVGFLKMTKKLDESNKKLQESNDELETILFTTKDGIAILDLQTNFLFFNDSYLKMTGFSKEELLTKSCAGLSMSEDLPKALKAIEEVMQKGFIENFEKTCIVKDGKRVNTNMAISLMPDQKRLLISVKNITEAKRKEKLLQEYVALINSNIITSSSDTQGDITYVSEKFCEISGYSKEELIGQNHRMIRHPDMPDSLYKEIWETITQHKLWSGEIKNLKKDGGYYWVKASIYASFDFDGNHIGYTAIRQDITDKKTVEEISITDGLTHIFNRRHFNETFPKVINSAKRNNELVCFLMMDIDHFKKYNDNYGHQAGDDVLINFAACLKQTLKRSDDIAFRLGGEEFGIVYKAEDKHKAFAFANTVRCAIENLKIPHAFSSASSYVTASMGLVCRNADTINNMDEVYKEADVLLYEAKESGRNKVAVNS